MNKTNVVIKARDLRESYSVLQELSTMKSKSATYALFFGLNMKTLEENFAEIEAQRIELIKRYGKEDETGNVEVTKENYPDFSEAFSGLMEAELAVELYLFSASKLELMFFDVTPIQMIKISYMVQYD